MEQEIDDQVQTGEPDPAKRLYDGLHAEGSYTKSFEEFKAKYSKPEELSKLYKGLSEEGSYTKSKEDFVKQYFPQPAGMAKPEEPKPAPQVDQFGKEISPATDDEVFGLANERRKLKGQNADLRLNAIDQSLKAGGYDPNEVEREFSDMPTIPGFNAKQALALKAENPALYDRKKAAIKSQVGLVEAVKAQVTAAESQYNGKEAGAKAGKEAGKAFLDHYIAGQFAKNYEAQRAATREAVQAAHTFIPDADKQHKVLADLARDKSYGYGIGLPGMDEAIAADPRSKNWNPYQVVGMHFMEDLDPATAKSFNRLLAFTPEEIELHKNEPGFMRGWELKSRDLEDIGMNVTGKSLEEKMTAMLPNKAKWTPEQLQDFQNMYTKYQDLQKDRDTQRERYPSMAIMDADQAMQDAMGESTRGVVEKTVLGMGENVDDAANWFGSLFKAPFLADKDVADADLTLLGNKRRTAGDQYETEGEALFGNRMKKEFSGDLGRKIAEIKADESLTKEEQRLEVTKAILDDNRKNIVLKPNDKADKINITGKTVLNAVSNIASEIAPQIVLGMITGGGANVSKTRELMSLFGSTFATAYNDNYNDALEKNIPNPGAYAMAHTTVDAATELIGNNIEMAKKMFGNKAVGKILGEMTQGEFSAIAKTGGKFARLKEAVLSSGKSAIGDAKNEAFEEAVGAVGGNAVDKNLFNQDVNMTDQAFENFTSTFIGMLPLGLLGLPANYRNINKNQQYALFEAGMDPQKFMAKIDQDLASKAITEAEADKRRILIQRATAAVQEMKSTRADGSPLTDNEKAKYVTNAVTLADIKEAETGASKEIKADLDLQKDLIEADQNDIMTPPPPKLDRATIEADRKADIEAANKEYAGRKREFKKEQTDKIRAHYDAKIIELEKQEAEEAKEEEAKAAEEEKKIEADKPTEEKPETKPIETEEDLIKELQNVRPVQPTPDQSKGVSAQPESESAGVQTENGTAAEGDNKGLRATGDQVQDNNNDRQLPAEGVAGRTVNGDFKLSSESAQHPVAEDIHKYKNPVAAIDEVLRDYKGDPVYERAAQFLKPIIEANPQIHIDTEAEGTPGVMGFSHNSGKIDINFPLHKNQGEVLGTMLHEMMHAATRQEMSNNKAFNDELQDVLSEVREKGWGDLMSFIKAKRENFGETYGTTNTSEMVAEIFSNPDFYNKVKAIPYKGQSLLSYIFEKIIGLFSKNYRALSRFKNETDAKDMAEYLQQLIERTVPANTNIKPVEGGGDASLQDPKDQEEAIKNIIRRTAPTLANSTILKNITTATGIDPAIVQQWIDDVRKPPAPPPAGKTLADMSPEEKDFAFRQFEKILEYQEPGKPSVFKRAWDSLVNASANIDNPYRFVTKMVDDILKHYGGDAPAIPLGRVFEKSSAGKASDAVANFKNQVVDGNINGEKLGKLSGKKYKDFQIYMAARRVIDRLKTQEAKRRQGEEVNRQTGNLTVRQAQATLAKLTDKYGMDIQDDFEIRADAFQSFMDNMLQDLTAAGILSTESYSKIKADNDFYAPFNVVREQMAVDTKQSAGIAGIVKRIKGIGYNLQTFQDGDPLEILNKLAEGLKEKIIGPDAYYDAALALLDNALNKNTINKEQYDAYKESLASPGFAIKDLVSAGANMIYKAQGMALKNTMMQRLYAYKAHDTEGLFIQDTDYLTPMTVGNETRMVTKPLNTIPVDEGMAPVKVKLNGKDVVVAINKKAADKINGQSNTDLPWIMNFANFLNKGFRFFVITTSPGFQVANVMIDAVRTAMLSRYGPLAGKGLVEPIVNALLYVPQYLEALGHSALGNLGYKTDAYKEWMNSDSFSKGLYDNLFTKEGEIKDIGASTAKKILNGFLSLEFVEIPGSILEQSHKIATFERGLSVEGVDSEMKTTQFAKDAKNMIASVFKQHVNDNMTKQELSDAMDRVNYEVQNYAGSPNFPQTAPWLKAASIFLQFFSARVKGEISDYRRVASIFANHGEGIKFGNQERVQMMAQLASIAAVIGTYAMKNNDDDDDEKEFNTVSPYYRDNYLNIPGGTFEYTDEDGNTSTHRDYLKIPLRGLTASMNVSANEYVKWRKGTNPDAFKNMMGATAANVSPLNLSGDDSKEYAESGFSNLTPVFKYITEWSFNRDTHAHRDIIPYKMLKGIKAWDDDTERDKNKRKGIAPWNVAVKTTPEWCKTLSEYMYDHLGVSVTAITLRHMEQTMGSPTKIYNNSLGKRFHRSEADYPVTGSRPAKQP